ncbi:MAG: hypothetical protein KDA41_00100 [Planctomycetales bacterium]|nr:hypothetical protein [Planctomycetales bacterium]
MSHSAQPEAAAPAETLTAELDALQDQVMQQLDELDQRILATIQDCLKLYAIDAPAPSVPVDAAA